MPLSHLPAAPTSPLSRMSRSQELPHELFALLYDLV